MADSSEGSLAVYPGGQTGGLRLPSELTQGDDPATGRTGQGEISGTVAAEGIRRRDCCVRSETTVFVMSRDEVRTRQSEQMWRNHVRH